MPQSSDFLGQILFVCTPSHFDIVVAPFSVTKWIEIKVDQETVLLILLGLH